MDILCDKMRRLMKQLIMVQLNNIMNNMVMILHIPREKSVKCGHIQLLILSSHICLPPHGPLLPILYGAYDTVIILVIADIIRISQRLLECHNTPIL